MVGAFWEYAEAKRLGIRLRCGRQLTDLVTDELVDLHHRITDRVGGDAGLELDVRDFERTFKRGCDHFLDHYMYGRW